MLDEPQLNKEIGRLIEAGSQGQLLALHQAIERTRLLADADTRDEYLRKIIRILARSAQWDEAMGLVDQLNHLVEKKEALLTIAEGLIGIGQIEQAERPLLEAERVATRIAGERFWMWQRAEALDQIALLRSTAGQEEYASRLWQQAIDTATLGQGNNNDPQEVWDSAGVLADIAQHLAEVGQVALAKSIASYIRFENRRESAQEAITRIAANRRF